MGAKKYPVKMKKKITVNHRYYVIRQWLRENATGYYKLVWNGPDWCEVAFVNEVDATWCVLRWA